MPDNSSRTAHAVSAAGYARRDFLLHSLSVPIGVATIAASASWLSGCSREPATAEGFHVLRPQDVPMLEKLLPAVISSAMPANAAARQQAIAGTVRSFDQLLRDTSPVIRDAFIPLLDLLTTGITRGTLFGVWKSWENTTADTAQAMLDDWSRSRSGFMRAACNAFFTFAAMSWYLDPEHQAFTGYPGPPRKLPAGNA